MSSASRARQPCSKNPLHFWPAKVDLGGLSRLPGLFYEPDGSTACIRLAALQSPFRLLYVGGQRGPAHDVGVATQVGASIEHLRRGAPHLRLLD